MSDTKSSHAGLCRASMKAIVEAIKNDEFIIENQVDVIYRLDHPSRRIQGNLAKYRLEIQPSGWSQIASGGALDVQYFFWIVIKTKPAMLSENEDEVFTEIGERLTDLLHRHVFGELATFVSKTSINYESITLIQNSKEIVVKLAADEVGMVMQLWQSPKSLKQVEDDKMEG